MVGFAQMMVMLCDTPPWQYHPMTVNANGEIDGDNPWEDFADMFMNYVFNSFANNSAGDARNSWMQDNMGHWLDLANR